MFEEAYALTSRKPLTGSPAESQLENAPSDPVLQPFTNTHCVFTQPYKETRYPGSVHTEQLEATARLHLEHKSNNIINKILHLLGNLNYREMQYIVPLDF